MPELKSAWIDDFMPDDWPDQPRNGRFVGIAWVMDVPGGCEFYLEVNVHAGGGGTWDELLPSSGDDGWMHIDLQRRVVTLWLGKWRAAHGKPSTPPRWQTRR